MLLAFLALRSFLLGFLEFLDHLGEVHQPFLAPMFLVGLVHVRRLASGWAEGLAILVIAAAVARVVGLVGATMSLAQLAKLLGTRLFRDSIG